MTSNQNEVYQRTIDLIAELTEVDVNEIKQNTILYEIGFNSLMGLELAVYLEREFDIRLEENELGEIKTVEDILNFCLEKGIK